MDDLDKALSLHRQGKLEEAEKIYLEILKKDRNNPEILQLVGTINLQTQKYEISEEYFLKSLKEDSNNPGTLNNLSKSLRVVTISPLEMIVRTKSNITKRSIAINEVSILRQSKQAASLSISSNSKNIIKNLVSDGVLVSTPAGSTAYNLSVHGPILGIDSKKLAISPISPFRPRRWKGKILSLIHI